MTSISVTAPVRAPQAADAATQQVAPAPSSEDKAKAVAQLYFSPVVRIDPKTESVVWEVRDTETGVVVRQWPPDHTTKAYRAQIPATSAPQTAEGAAAQELAVEPAQVVADSNSHPKG